LKLKVKLSLLFAFTNSNFQNIPSPDIVSRTGVASDRTTVQKFLCVYCEQYEHND